MKLYYCHNQRQYFRDRVIKTKTAKHLLNITYKKRTKPTSWATIVKVLISWCTKWYESIKMQKETYKYMEQL